MLRKVSIICLFVLCTLLPVSAETFTDDSTGISIQYTIVDDGVEVTNIGDSTTTTLDELIIPDEVTYNGETYKVVSIGKYSAYYLKTISGSLVIGDNVITIGEHAFTMLDSCGSIIFGKSVETIEQYVFGALNSCRSITFGRSVSTIGNYAFGNLRYCDSITSLNTTPPSCEKYSFGGWESDYVLYIPYGCTEAYSSATIWSSIGSIVEVYTGPEIGSKVLSDDGLYYNILSESTVEVTWGGNSSTSGTDSYTGEITIPSQTTIEGYTYDVVGIGTYAFDNCTSLTAITIAESVTYIGNNAFYQCSSLEGQLTLPAELTSIGQAAFGTCSRLSGTLTIPDKVTTISALAFGDCSAIEGLVIGKSVETIDSSVFFNCTTLAGELVIPNTVTSIGTSAFSGCSKLTSLTLGESVTTIDVMAFYGCSGFTGELKIPDSVTIIKETAFQNCKGFTSLTLGEGLKTIGNRAFYSCSSIAGEVKIPDSVTSLGTYAFQYCSKIESVIIGNGLSSIDQQTFDGCSALTTVTIGSNVSSISAYGPFDNTALSAVIVKRATPPSCGSSSFPSSTIANATLYVPCNCGETYAATNIWKNFGTILEECTGLYADGLYYDILSTDEAAVVAPEEGSYTGELVIPAVATIDGSNYTVVGIGDSAFEGCEEITLTVGSCVETIGMHAFAKASGSITLLNPTPATLGSGVFSERNAVIYIPAGTKDVYSQEWRNTYEELGYAVLKIVATDDEDLGYATYYNKDYDVTIPENINAYYAQYIDWDNTVELCKIEGTIPAGTAVVLTGDLTNGTTATATLSTTETTYTTNLLHGQSLTKKITAEEGYTYYMLTTQSDGSGLGFYYGATDGGVFTSQANKAWLAVNSDSYKVEHNPLPVRFNSDDTTGITTLPTTAEKTDNNIYTINGIRVATPSKPGIYITNGKKIVVR